MQGPPPGTIASLDVERGERRHIGLQRIFFERQEWSGDLVSVCGLDPHQLNKATVLFASDAPAPSTPTDGLPSLEKP
jgi:hypothetical protein